MARRALLVLAALACIALGCTAVPAPASRSVLTPDLAAEERCVVGEIAAWRPDLSLIAAKCSRGEIVARTEPMLRWLFSSALFRDRYQTAVQVLSWQMQELSWRMRALDGSTSASPGEAAQESGTLPPLPPPVEASH
jgi:hypothetical protein